MWPASGDSGLIKARVRDDDGRERQRKAERREREREKESRLDLAVRQLERIACAMVRTSASCSDRERKRECEREARAYACVCRALCTCIARWSAMADRPQLAKSALSYVQCENECGYRLRAKESTMRSINSLCDPYVEVDSSGFYEDRTSASTICFLILIL